jgi:HlyD family secretion protein
VNVEEGAKVKEGDLLASLACEDTRIAQKLAEENFSRAERLRKSGAVSQEAFDQVASKKQDADARLGWCDIRSPIPATVLARLHEPGEWVNPGTKILSLANLEDVWAYVYVPSEKIAALKTGMKVPVFLPEMGERKWEGTIRKINEEAEFTPKNVQTRSERSRLVFGIKVAIPNADETLKPGMTVEVVFPET